MESSDERRRRPRRGPTVRRVRALALVVAALCLLGGVGTAAAHSGSLRGATRGTLAVPTWLFLLTGGGAIGASFLLASFVTDRAFVRSLHEWGREVAFPRSLTAVGRLLGLAALATVLLAGVFGPSTGVRNLGVLLVWVVFWGGYVASTYLVGNTWPAVDPFRTLASLLPSLDRPYPERLGAWPSVVGLLALIWVEVATPLADDPRLLATVVAAYGAVTLAGATAFGADRWFGTVDPVARAFRYYGHVAPLHRTDEGIRLRLPGAGLTDPDLVDGTDEAAFVVALLFVTTYDGLVATGPWAGVARAAVAAGVPAPAVYLLAYLGGFALFYAGYRLAAGSARRTAGTFLSADALVRRFAPPLLAIAAGYHLAHNLGTVLSLAPAVLAVASAPLSPPQNPPVLAGLPGWFSGLELAFVLVGHVLAVWVAHDTAYGTFPARLQAVRSQYGVTLAMVFYTMTSLWIVSEPYVPPPFLT